jgi:hypothetical protein
MVHLKLLFDVDGKRFKTRSGDTVRLIDLLDEAVTRMEAQLRERISSGSANISEDEVHKAACILGYGAVKYFDLRRNPTSNYIFSYDRMLDTKVRRFLPFSMLLVDLRMVCLPYVSFLLFTWNFRGILQFICCMLMHDLSLSYRRRKQTTMSI